MSLVSEALRKARAESLAGGDHHRGVVFRTTVVLGARGPRIGLGWLLGGAALAAAAAGGAVAWWLVSGHTGPSPTPAVATTVALPPAWGPTAPAAFPTPASPAAAAPAARPPASVPTAADGNLPVHESQTVGAPQAAAEPSAGRPVASGPTPAAGDGAATTTATGPAQPGRPTPPAAPRAQAAAPVREPAAAAAGAERRPEAGAAAGARERSFGLDADLGYAKLHLDYIVYRSKDPFAGINGQQVVIGSIIEGFTVEEIGPDHVRLHDPRGEVTLQIPH